jgi:hypothetical protein
LQKCARHRGAQPAVCAGNENDFVFHGSNPSREVAGG